jgi:hypothetical protein
MNVNHDCTIFTHVVICYKGLTTIIDAGGCASIMNAPIGWF